MNGKEIVPVPVSEQVPSAPKLEGFTPRQQTRLRTFFNLIKLAEKQQKALNANEKHFFGAVNERGVIPPENIYFELDQAFVDRLNRLAFSLYADEFTKVPEMQGAADAMLDWTHQQIRGEPEKTLSPEELKTIFEREE